MDSGWAPGIDLSVYESETGVRDPKATVLVDGVGVGRCGDVEGVDTDYGFPFQSVEAGS